MDMFITTFYEDMKIELENKGLRLVQQFKAKDKVVYLFEFNPKIYSLFDKNEKVFISNKLFF